MTRKLMLSTDPDYDPKFDIWAKYSDADKIMMHEWCIKYPPEPTLTGCECESSIESIEALNRGCVYWNKIIS